ncbi:MAG TPA: hypothetical protein VEW28_08855 [Candidatus Kapabacteria bacterium]|nr:hypothetical protein [Candidatus Kapabacteria bacterium]
MRRLLFILFIVLGAPSAFAQLRDTLIGEWWSPGAIASLPTVNSLTGLQQRNAIELDFDHTRSLYNWGEGSVIKTPSSYNILQTPSLYFASEARSQFREDTRTRTNEGTAYLQSIFPVQTGSLGITTTLFGTTYSLNQSPTVLGTLFSSVQRLSDGYALAGVNYIPSSDLTISAAAGGAYKSFQYGKSGGNIFQALGALSPVSVSDGSLIDLSASLDERRFPSLGEASRNDGARVHYVSALGDGGSNDAAASFVVRRQDFYFAVDSLAPYARQERNETTFELSDSLHYPIAPKIVDWYLEAGIIPKSINRSTKGVNFANVSQGFLTSSTFLLPSTTSTFDLDLGTRFIWKLGAAADARSPIVSGGLRFTENSETNDVNSSELSFASSDLLKKLSGIFQATSFDGKQSVLNADAFIPLYEHDVLQASFSSRLYRYDTPSEDNHDDRDELYLNGTLGYSHIFSDRLSGSAAVRLSKSHLVYLKSDRSAQNFVSKTISLVLSSAYSGEHIQNSISSEVFSNYAVYDFILPSAGPTGNPDYLIRGINASDSLLISIGRWPFLGNAIGMFESDLTFRLYERGAYNSGSFSERPLLRTNELSGDVTINIQDRSSGAPVLVKLGARTFYQLRSAPATAETTALSLQERVNRFGPLVVIVLDEQRASGLRFYGSVWYSILKHDSFDLNSFSSTTLIEGRLGARWTF